MFLFMDVCLFVHSLSMQLEVLDITVLGLYLAVSEESQSVCAVVHRVCSSAFGSVHMVFW